MGAHQMETCMNLGIGEKGWREPPGGSDIAAEA